MMSQTPRAPISDAETRKYYDTFSESYDTPRSDGYHAMIDRLEVDVARPYAMGADVLELGCGTGLILEQLAPHARRAVGIDLSPKMAERAQARGLDVRVGSIVELPFEDASFDLVCSFKVLAHVSEIRQTLAEAARVTRPGGHMLLEFYNRWSLRYVAKTVAGPQSISAGCNESHVYTRWDSPLVIPGMLPPNVKLLTYCGIRVFTPFAGVHRVAPVAKVLQHAERLAMRSPLRYFGGFLVAVMQKTDNA